MTPLTTPKRFLATHLSGSYPILTSASAFPLDSAIKRPKRSVEYPTDQDPRIRTLHQSIRTMASEGQNAGPSDQPALGARPSLTSQQSQTLKSYGQDYQFAETWANPPPEFVVSTGAASNDHNPGLLEEAHNNGGGHGGANLASVGGSFKTKESQHTADEQPEVIWVPPSDKPWYKRIAKLWWMIGGISTLGIIAVILAILGALGMLSGHHNKSVLHTSDPYPPGTSTSLTSTSTPAESTASATSSIEPSSSATGTSTSSAASPTSTVSLLPSTLLLSSKTTPANKDCE